MGGGLIECGRPAVSHPAGPQDCFLLGWHCQPSGAALGVSYASFNFIFTAVE